MSTIMMHPNHDQTDTEPEHPVPVVITDLRMTNKRIIYRMVQFALCAIPAAAILVGIAVIVWLGIWDMLR